MGVTDDFLARTKCVCSMRNQTFIRWSAFIGWYNNIIISPPSCSKANEYKTEKTKNNYINTICDINYIILLTIWLIKVISIVNSCVCGIY